MSQKNISRLDSYALMIIALCALFVSIWQVNLQRKHDRISMMPYLEWNNGQDKEGFTWVKLKNKGFGPAVIESGAIVTADTTFNDWKSAIHHFDSSVDIKQWTTVGQLTLLPNEEFLMVTAKGGETPVNYTFEIKYKDAYDYEYEDRLQHVGYPFR